MMWKGVVDVDGCSISRRGVDSCRPIARSDQLLPSRLDVRPREECPSVQRQTESRGRRGSDVVLAIRRRRVAKQPKGYQKYSETRWCSDSWCSDVLM